MNRFKHPLLGGFLALSGFCFSASAQAQVSYHASSEAYAQFVPANGSTQTSGMKNEQTQSGPVSTSATDTFQSGPAQASTNASASAAPGTLRAYAASSNAGAGTGEFITAGQTIVSRSLSQADYTDMLTVTSTTLAAGTPVELMFTGAYHWSLDYQFTTVPGQPPATATYNYANGVFALRLNDQNFDPLTYIAQRQYEDNITLTGTYATTVGSVINFHPFLFALSDESSNGAGSLNASSFDARDTARFFADAVTSGAEIRSASGFDYASSPAAVPEASSVVSLGLLLLLGTSNMVIAGRKKKTG